MKQIILPEIISVGIFNAEIALKNKTISKRRRATMFELELPIEDGGTSYVDNESHPISRNTVIVAKPTQLRHTRLPFKCYYIHMIINKGEIADALTGLPNFIELTDSERIREIFRKIAENYGNSPLENELMLHSMILELLYLLQKSSYSQSIRHRAKSSNREVIEQSIEYIKNNLTADLSLENLASLASFTPTYFHKLFKVSTGERLRDFVETQRIKKSVDLLISTDMTLTEISYECGFSSQSYFSYAFKRKHGVSPREYVKKLICEYGEAKTNQ